MHAGCVFYIGVSVRRILHTHTQIMLKGKLNTYKANTSISFSCRLFAQEEDIVDASATKMYSNEDNNTHPAGCNSSSSIIIVIKSKCYDS